MIAAQITRFGHPNVLKINDIPEPEPHDGQVLVEVHASSINPFDTIMREGQVKFPLPATLGGDIAGVVKKVSSGVSHVKPGDSVYGQANVLSGASGAFAEFATTGANQVARIPKNLSFSEAASLVLTGLSALQVIEGKMKLQSGQTILIHGAAGGIGSVAVQIAKHLGAVVTAAATGRGVEYVKALGADHSIDYQAGPFEAGLSGFDAVFATVPGDIVDRSFQVLRRGGILVSMLGTPSAELAAKYGVTAIGQQTRTSPESLNRLSELVEQRAVSPHIDQVFALPEIAKAFEARESGHPLGKVVVQIRP
jgi:alcohol dehydrogenase